MSSRSSSAARGITSADLTALVAGICGDALDDARRGPSLALLAENGRLDFLPEIAAQFEELKAEAENVVDVEVVSAAALDERQRERLAASAAHSACAATCGCTAAVDPSLIGGAVVRSGDLADRRLAEGRLERLETELTG